MPFLPPKLPTIEAIERHPWVPYTDDGGLFSCSQKVESRIILTLAGVPLQLSCEQHSNERSVFTCFCELSELAHQSLYLVHNPNRPLMAKGLLQVYTKYLIWYDQLPEALRLGQNFTPYVLFVQ